MRVLRSSRWVGSTHLVFGVAECINQDEYKRFLAVNHAMFFDLLSPVLEG